MALCGQGQGLGRARRLDREAPRHLRAALPSRPAREQDHRQGRQQPTAVVAFFLALVHLLAAQPCASEALDSAGRPTREAPRRGAGGLPGLADMGWRNRLGWYAGGPLLGAVPPVGVIPGLGGGATSPQEQPRAETCVAWRRFPPPGLASGGGPARGPYGVDKGGEGQANQRAGWTTSGAHVLCPPQRTSKRPWPTPWRRWLAGVRQMVETVQEKRPPPFRLDRDRPHALSGWPARLAARMALHNFCLWVHEQLGRPRRAFADLVDW